MSKKINSMKNIFFLIFVMGVLASGCVTLKKPLSTVKEPTEKIRVQRVISDVLLTEKIGKLSNRIDEYQKLKKKLKREGRDNSEALTYLQQSQDIAEELHKTYNEIKKLQGKLLKYKSYNKERALYRTIIDGLFQRLVQLEDGYFKDKSGISVTQKQVFEKYHHDLKEIESYCENGDSLKLVESYKKAATIYGEDIIPVNIKLCYAEALSNTNHVRKAIGVAEEVIGKESSDLITLYSNLIDWYLETKSTEKALKNFHELSKELDRKMEVFLTSRKKITSPSHGESDKLTKKLLGSDIVEEDIKPTKDKTKDSNAEENAGEGKEVDESQKLFKKADVHGRIMETNDSVSQKVFQEAHGIPIKLKEHEETQSGIHETDKAQETHMPSEDEVKEQMEDEMFIMAKRLMESGKYEEAVSELMKLKDGERYGQDSQELIQRSIDEYASQKREAAAKLFLMAKRTTDGEEKKGMLLKSFESLKEVISKYPTCSYSEKIIKNIETVKEEILKIDPLFSQRESKHDETLAD
ncbi:MAG: hypothetical protein SVY10_09295 [Thermodesulfobacteriota bacterium]|nr:hypothetical protein [Thermodesulfobacteriota bacterium]